MIHPSIKEINEVIEKIKYIEEKRKKLSDFLKNINGLKWKVDTVDLNNLEIGGEDGGLIKKSTHLIDFVFLRCVSVIFRYLNNKLDEVIYYPSTNPTPEVDYSKDPLSDIEFRIFWSLRRMKKEIKLSIETIEKYSPDLFLIDGSLTIHPGDIPKKESILYDDYLELKNLLKELYISSKKKNCLLAGVIEDSRSSAFCEYISKEIFSKIKSKKVPELQEILKKTKDTNLLNYVLNKGEATKIIDISENLKCVYLKTVEYDRPIRIEFLNEDDAKKIVNILYTISSQSKTYGLPNVLIEADQRAKLSELDIEYYMNLIASKAGMHRLLFLRRENRPF